MRLTARGWLFLVLAGLAFLASMPTSDITLRLASGCLVAAVAIDLLFVERGLSRVVLRVGPRSCVAGRRFTEDFVVTLDGLAGSRVRRDTLIGFRLFEPDSQTRDSATTIRSLRSGERLQAGLECRFRERGVRLEREFVLESPSLFGAFSSRRAIGLETELTVEPARLAVDDALARTLDEFLEDMHARASDRGDEFWSLREYRIGEDLRHVHGVRSAAMARMLVRETRGVEHEQIEIVLDLRAREDTMTQHARFELALRFAASFADRADDPGLRLSATIVGAHGYAHYDLEIPERRRAFLRVLAAATPNPVETLDESVLEYFDRRPRGVRCVLIESGVEDPELVTRVGNSLRPLHVSGRAPLRTPGTENG